MIKGEVSSEAQILLFIFFTLAIAILIKQIQKRYTFISYTPTLFFVSVILGYFYESEGIIGGAISQISTMDPRGILIIFLPPLIFESAFNSDWHIFRKQSTQIFILAFPAVVVSALTLMFCIKVIIGYDQSYYNWSEAFMFGSVLSCTDTVAVLALLKQAGAPKKFNSLIQGQSLFNDGTCMVLLTISFQLVKGGAPQPLSIFVLFLQLTLGGIFLGVLFGMVSSFLIKLVSNDHILTLNITLASCYLTYFTAEYVDLGIHVSGIMSLVSLGLYMAAFGKTRIPGESREKINHFWNIMTFLTETVIFIVGGVLVGINVLNNKDMEVVTQNDFGRLLLLYLCMMFARFFSISIFMPKLQTTGYGLKWNQVVVLTYGGLRGAVGISFALILASDGMLNKKFTFISLFNMAGCSILTLLINASTASFVIKKVGLCVKSDTKTRLFMKFMGECAKDLRDKIYELQQDKNLDGANWQKVHDQGGLKSLQEHLKKTQIRVTITNEQIRSTNIEMNNLNANLLDRVGNQLDSTLMMQIRNRFSVFLKGIFWEKFERNQCSRQSIIILIESVDWDLDTLDQPLDSWEFLVSHIDNKYIFPICFWAKKYPIIGGIADSVIFDKAGAIYDVVSTYMEGLLECETKCKQFPFDLHFLDRVIQQSEQNRKLAKNYLDYQIKIAYPQIMKRIQTDKASQSVLNFQKIFLQFTYRYGQIDDQFYKMLRAEIQTSIRNVQSQSYKKEAIKDSDILKQNQFFKEMSINDINSLIACKMNITVQKQESLIKPYEKQKYLFLITRGEISEQCKKDNQTIYKVNKRLYDFVGLNSILMANRRDLQHSANATSIVCMFAFPLQNIRQIIIKNQKLEGILYKDVLSCMLKADKRFDRLKKSSEYLSFMKPFLQFKRLLKKEEATVQDKSVILLEGNTNLSHQESKIEMNQEPGSEKKKSEEFSGTGYYDLKQGQKLIIIGPAKYFTFDEGKLRKSKRKSRNSSQFAHLRQNQDRRTNIIYQRAMFN